MEWPKSKLEITPEAEIEAEKEVKAAEIFQLMTCAPLEGPGGPLLMRYSNWRKILRITAYLLRFVHNARQKDRAKRRAGKALTVIDTCNAVDYWAKLVQGREYAKEIECIRTGDKQLPDKTKLASLRPFLDENGVLRVGGRIGNAPIEFGRKHPIIIPPKTRVTYLILHQAHLDTHHGGAQVMMAVIRSAYWIPKLRMECRKFISTCTACVRWAKRVDNQIMAELPLERVRPAQAFQRCGVDMAGPFMMNGRVYDTRSKTWYGPKQITKGYITVFVCLVTRAVHLEAVTSMSADSFLAAFLRFTGRRGHCELMLSDNGTNFVGANGELAEAFESWQSDEMQHAINAEGVEACLNSRPLSAMSDDPNDMEILTPAHFLIGRPLRLPLPMEPGRAPVVTGRRLYESMRAQQNDFWKAWSTDYLSTLMQIPKWRRIRDNVRVGQLVLIQAENYAPTFWLLGRVTRTYPGSDGRVRSATVKVANGELDRSTRKLVVLPTEEDILDHWRD